MVTRAFVRLILAVLVFGLCAAAQDQEQPPQRSTSSTGDQYYQELFHPFGKPAGDQGEGVLVVHGPEESLNVVERIQRHLQKETKRTGGTYSLKDELLGKTWTLRPLRAGRPELIWIVKNRYDERYVAMSEFESEDAVPVTVAFTIKRDWKGSWKVAESEVYRVNHAPRFFYYYSTKRRAYVKAPLTSGPIDKPVN